LILTIRKNHQEQYEVKNSNLIQDDLTEILPQKTLRFYLGRFLEGKMKRFRKIFRQEGKIFLKFSREK